MILPRDLTLDLDFAPQLATNSPVRALALRTDYVLVRPYSPAGRTRSGLWLERNPKHPKIWAWLLAVPREIRVAYPSIIPGEMVVISRWDGERILEERPLRPRYIGHTHAVVALPVEGIHATIVPSLVSMEDARASN